MAFLPLQAKLHCCNVSCQRHLQSQRHQQQDQNLPSDIELVVIHLLTIGVWQWVRIVDNPIPVYGWGNLNGKARRWLDLGPIKMVQIYHPKVSAIIGGIWISQKQGCGISTPQEYVKQLEVGILLKMMIGKEQNNQMYSLRLFRRITSWDFDLSQAILEGATRGESVCEESLFGRFQRLNNYHNHQKPI